MSRKTVNASLSEPKKQIKSLEKNNIIVQYIVQLV